MEGAEYCILRPFPAGTEQGSCHKRSQLDQLSETHPQVFLGSGFRFPRFRGHAGLRKKTKDGEDDLGCYPEDSLSMTGCSGR